MRAIRARTVSEAVRPSPELAVRFGLSALSQGLSSGTNFGLTVALAVSLSAQDFGRIISVYSVYMMTLSMSRALTTDVLVVAEGSAGSSLWNWARRRLLVTGGLGAGAALAVGMIVDVRGTTLLLLVSSIPLLVMQDGVRQLAWANGQPRLALASDGVWLAATLVIAGVIAVVRSRLAPDAIIFAWCAGGFAALLFGWWRVVAHVRPSGDERRQLTPVLSRYRAMASSQAMMAVAVNLGPVLVAVTVSSTMAGVMKAAILPVSPVLSLFAGLRVVTLPAIRESVTRGQVATLTSTLVAVAGSVSAIGAGVSIWIVRRLPAGWVGESIALVEPYLHWSVLICAMFVIGQQLADSTALAGRRAVTERRLLTIATEWCCLLIGVSLLGAKGLVVGWTIGLALSTAAWVRPALRP